MIDEKQLIARVISQSDQHAFATLMKVHQQPVRQFLRRLTGGDHALADDLAQETFIRVYQKLDSFLGKASFSTWIHKIAYHCFLRSQQKAWVSRETAELDLSLFEAAADNAEKDLMIERLMAKLELAERLCITLSVSAGMSHQEICELVDMPLGTVKSHITRGKQKLMAMVK